MSMNVANWHGIQAARSWNKGDMRGFKRHTRIADEMWAACGAGKSGHKQAALSARLQAEYAKQPTVESVFGESTTPRRRDQHVVVLIKGRPVQVVRKGRR